MNVHIFYNKKPSIESLIALYVDAGWGRLDDYSTDVKKKFEGALQHSNIITAYNNEVLVGALRFFSDNFHDTQIIEFIVLKEYQKKGIGKLLFDKLVADFGDTDIYINSTEIAANTLKHYGFKKHHLSGMSFTKKN